MKKRENYNAQIKGSWNFEPYKKYKNSKYTNKIPEQIIKYFCIRKINYEI